MATKRHPSSESNPLPMQDASLVGQLLPGSRQFWKYDKTPPAQKYAACRLASVMNQPNHCAMADSEPVVSRCRDFCSSSQVSLDYFLHSPGCESVKC